MSQKSRQSLPAAGGGRTGSSLRLGAAGASEHAWQVRDLRYLFTRLLLSHWLKAALGGWYFSCQAHGQSRCQWPQRTLSGEEIQVLIAGLL